MVGREFPGLIEGPSQDSDLVWECRLPGQAPEIDGVVSVTRADDARKIKVTSSEIYRDVGGGCLKHVVDLMLVGDVPGEVDLAVESDVCVVYR